MSGSTQGERKLSRPALNASAIRLDLPGAMVVRDEGQPVNAESGLHAVSNVVRARFAVEPAFGHVEIEWTDGRREPERDHEIAAERLCRALSHALERTIGEIPLSPALQPSTALVRAVGTRRRGA